jgi:hypothetical protein
MLGLLGVLVYGGHASVNLQLQAILVIAWQFVF